MRACSCHWLVLVLVQPTLQLPYEEGIVYPHLLEGRAANGDKMLKISDDLTLTLEHRPAYGEHLLVVTQQEDGTHLHLYEPTSAYNKDLFQDREHMASVMVSHEDEGLHVNGVIGDEVRIKPMPRLQRSAGGIVPHLLYRERTSGHGSRPSDYPSVPVTEGGAEDVRYASGEGDLEERASGKVTLESHLVIDSTYLKAYGNNQTEIKRYFGIVLNSVNLRFATIKYPKVEIKIVGLTFNTKAAEEPYFKSYFNHDQYVAGKATLDSFIAYMREAHGALYKQVDAFFLITGRTLASLKNGVLSAAVNGMAFVGGACTGSLKAGICEDSPRSYEVVRTLTHEAAHVLGCVHDGDAPPTSLLREGSHPGAATCPWAEGFVMSYVTKDHKQFRFSSCCRKQIKYMSQLPSRGCLQEMSSKSLFPKPKTRLPGSETSLNDICKMAFAGQKEKFFYDTNVPLKGCRIACTTTVTKVIRENKVHVGRLTGKISSLDGSPCDENDATKVCIRGFCKRKPEYRYKKGVLPTTTRKGTVYGPNKRS